MKPISALKTIVVIASVLFLSIAMIRCTKTGFVAKQLDRTLISIPDSGVFSSFYDTTLVSVHDVVPDKNDVIVSKGVMTIINQYCNTANCHAGPISPKFTNYSELIKYVVPGNPSASKLWQAVSTNDFNKAMPPVSVGTELSLTERTTIYNWILNGAKEFPTILDFRPAAVNIIANGCGSANCHNQATATGAWARKGLINGITSADTIFYTYTKPTGSQSFYCLVTKQLIIDTAWKNYKDSVKKFYLDTLANASFRPYKTFGTPVSAYSTRGPLNTYDDILMDIMYPKSPRSQSSIQYTNNGMNYYVKGNYLNGTSSLITRVDSTIIMANPYTGAWTTHQVKKDGDMAWSDGGLRPSEIAIIKAWYFSDPNIPTVWKYGNNNVGIFKYWKSGNPIKQ